MIKELTEFIDYFRKMPIVFLIAISLVLGLILFLPDELANSLAVDVFRNEYRIILGPAFLITVCFLIVSIFIFFKKYYFTQRMITKRNRSLHELTPEEKGYLVPYIEKEQNTIYVGSDDGIMGGLCMKEITYRASSMGSFKKGIAYNLQPWARKYLDKNSYVLNGYIGKPMTPLEKKLSS